MLSGGLRWPSEVKRCWLIAETPIDAVALLIRGRWRGVPRAARGRFGVVENHPASALRVRNSQERSGICA